MASRNVLGDVSYKVYDGLGRVAYDVDAERYVTGTTYDAFGNALTVTRYAQALDEAVFATKEVATNLTGFTLAEFNALMAGDSGPVSVSNTAQTIIDAPAQPYPYQASATSDEMVPATEAGTLNVTQSAALQSPNVVNTAYIRSGTTLVESTGVSMTVDSSLYADTTPTSVKATIYDSDGNLYDIVTMDLGYSTDASGYGFVAYEWTSVSNWAGQVNLSYGDMAADIYTVDIEIRDSIKAAYQVSGDTYDGDGTWLRTGTQTIIVGTSAVPTLSWSAAAQPVNTTALFSYRPSVRHYRRVY